MKKSFIIVFLICITFQTKAQKREVQLLDTGWRFLNKEIPTTNVNQVDDSSWQTVTVPHDWAIAGPFDMTIDMQKVTVIEDGDRGAKLRTGRTGALPCFGIGWYRKALTISKSDEGKRVFVEFDGAMSRSKVYLNGVYVGEWPYGYSSFSFELTKYIQFGKENILSVRLENKEESSRWYSGAGIYRNVRLVKTTPVRVAHWGTYITTPVVTDQKGEVNIKTVIDGDGAIQLITEIYDAKGQKVGSAVANKKADGNSTLEQIIKVNKPVLWSVESPNLYTAVSKVFVGKTQKDEYKTTFGFRTIQFDKDKGFFLNGKYTKFKGVCLHHDLGSIGAAVNYRATERQLVMMKEMGVNAIRTSHNPPSLELLKICDSIGLMVQVEAFDEWKNGKNINGYGEFFDAWAEKDLTAMIKRDRNHPSVIMWSIGNEIREQGMPEGAQMAKFLTKISHDLDPTRPVSAGFNNWKGAIKNGLAAEVDLVGFNYAPDFYEKMRQENPNFTIYGSETASTVSSRGEYKFPVVASKKAWYTDYQLTSYDLETCSWADLPDFEFQYQDDLEFVAGEFVWTGFDYLGEPSPYNEGTPARSSYFGIVDLAGIPKDRYYLYKSKWSDKPVFHVLPHWTWPDRLNQNVPVFCYTNYPKAELFVNEKSMGTRVKDKSSMLKRYRLMWDDVIYEPGEIKVVAYDKNDKVVAEKIIKTAGETYTIKLTADRQTIKADGKDLSFVTVELLDKNGNLCPRAANLLFVDVTGAGKLKAVCNGDATDQTSFASKYMRTFNGKLVVTVESDTNPGDITLKVSGGLLKAEEVKITTENVTK
jgi:beta-galactosidase